jgi:hypothetical protein
MESMQIRRLAGTCEAMFRARIMACEAGNKDFGGGAQVLEEQIARFNLWADNNGETL